MSAMNFDHIYPVDNIEPDFEVSVRQVLSSPGGSGANTATALARLGIDAAVAGVVGDDQKGLHLRGALTKDGIDVEHLLTGNEQDGPTGETVILAKGLSNGGRMIVVNAGVNNHYASIMDRNLQTTALAQAMRTSRIVHFSSFVGSQERARQAELIASLEPDTIVSLNPGMIYSRLGLDLVAGMLGRSDILFVYENMLDSLLGWNDAPAGSQDVLSKKLGALSDELSRRGLAVPSVILVKRSWSEGHAHYVELCDRCGVTRHNCSARFAAGEGAGVDPTGAGDAMAAGIIFALLKGLDTQDAVDLAYVMAMSASSDFGGRSGLPWRTELGSRWATHLGSLRAVPAWIESVIEQEQ